MKKEYGTKQFFKEIFSFITDLQEQIKYKNSLIESAKATRGRLQKKLQKSEKDRLQVEQLYNRLLEKYENLAQSNEDVLIRLKRYDDKNAALVDELLGSANSNTVPPPLSLFNFDEFLINNNYELDGISSNVYVKKGSSIRFFLYREVQTYQAASGLNAPTFREFAKPYPRNIAEAEDIIKSLNEPS